MNLTEANLQGPTEDPLWFELYTATSEYDLDDLSPESMDRLFQSMASDEQLFQRYYE